MTKKRPKRPPPHLLPTRSAPHPDDESQDLEVEPSTGDEAVAAGMGISTVARVADTHQIPHFVCDIKSAEQQVGEHILAALQDQGTVAVITAVVIGTDGVQRIVSAALDSALLQQVQHLMQVAEEEREEEAPCVGFHCLLKKKGRQR